MNENHDLFNFLKYILGCTYISDLRTEPYNTKAKLILERLYLSDYSLNQIRDTLKYISHELKK
jgi:hypothetical protein